MYGKSQEKASCAKTCQEPLGAKLVCPLSYKGEAREAGEIRENVMSRGCDSTPCHTDLKTEREREVCVCLGLGELGHRIIQKVWKKHVCWCALQQNNEEAAKRGTARLVPCSLARCCCSRGQGVHAWLVTYDFITTAATWDVFQVFFLDQNHHTLQSHINIKQQKIVYHWDKARTFSSVWFVLLRLNNQLILFNRDCTKQTHDYRNGGRLLVTTSWICVHFLAEHSCVGWWEASEGLCPGILGG